MLTKIKNKFRPVGQVRWSSEHNAMAFWDGKSWRKGGKTWYGFSELK